MSIASATAKKYFLVSGFLVTANLVAGGTTEITIADACRGLKSVD
jgi:hypothetical protein